MSDMGWPIFEKCTHPNLGTRDTCPDCCMYFMRICIRNGEFVHWLAAKMAEPTDAWQQFADKANSVTWDTLHRTQDGGYWIPPVYEQMTREVDEHLAGEEPRPLRTEPECTYTDREREQGAKVAAACAVNNGGRG